MRRVKVTVVGAGNVGGSIAQRLAEKNWYDVVLVDIVEGMPQGKALDLLEAGPVCSYDSLVTGTNHYEETKDSDIVVITSGIPRRPGMSRDELLETNTRIVSSVVRETAHRSPQAIFILVSNPLDAMTFVAHKVSGFPKHRVLGMAGVLDSARFRAFIAEALQISVENIHAMVLGGHGDSMVPLIRYTTVAGRPLHEWLSPEKLDALIKRTREGGAEIVNLLKTGSAYYAPAASVVEMVEAITKDQKKILPCAALCEGEYGYHNLFLGVPVKLGVGGAEAIIEYALTDQEKSALDASAKAVKDLCAQVEDMLKKAS
ncbi:MAG: malate dehydrogenase [Nitrospira sp.]|nr:malate dehydrogenase [Nitrospira sp.]MCA9475124.1 malate dehydrogenase [Nitrospira sp.]MCB9710867.1 malate dehydrogenase [Nitrospiraceae bacterium]MDR4486503.1 malate dehydrogenase [Nitrospirales bacterium]